MAGIRVNRAAKTLTLPFNGQLAGLLPSEHRVSGDNMVVPHTHDVVRLARNLGLQAPAPIMARYDWAGGTPWKTQRITAALLTMNKRAYVLSEMGTGKTRSTLYALDFLFQDKEITAALVVAPLSTITTVWYAETFRYFNHLSVGVLYGDRAKREAILSQNHQIYVINHDGIKTILPALRARRDIAAVVLDELATYRNARTDRWKAAAHLIAGRSYVWGLTGSPTPQEPTDAYGQVKLLTPERAPKFFKAFKEQTMYQVSTFKWVAKKDAKDTVYAHMQPAVRYKRDDCAELPPVIYQSREVALSKEQKRLYDEMIRKLKIVVDGHREAVAANEGVLMSKLLQITSGFVYTKDRTAVEIDSTERLDALLQIIEEAEGKVIVFADFIKASEMIAEKLRALGVPTAQVSGNTPKGERDQIFQEFEHSMYPRVLVAHPKCMAHGLTLVAANVIVWFTPTTSLEIYDQACARITRPGQTRTQYIIHLTGTTVESKLYKRLQQRSTLQGALLEMFE